MRKWLERLRTRLFLMKQDQLEKLVLRYSKMLTDHMHAADYCVEKDNISVFIENKEYEA